MILNFFVTIFDLLIIILNLIAILFSLLIIISNFAINNLINLKCHIHFFDFEKHFIIYIKKKLDNINIYF